MPITKGYKALLEAANSRIETVPAEAAVKLQGDANTVFVDIRDPRELERDGMVPDAFHAPRGMLEFWADPESPYYKDIFGSGKKLVFYCASGWRSALAADTLRDMGLENVAHMGGGLTAWKAAGGPVAQKAKKG